MTRFDVTTFGETMLRLSVPVGQPLAWARQLDVHVGGAESNVMAILAQLGHRCSWLGGLPQNALGQLAANELRLRQIDLSGVVWHENGRMGTYYIEMGAPPRTTQVIYDRANACVTQTTLAQVDWAHLLDTRLLHLTGITPALSASCQAIVAEALKRAQEAEIPVSFDVNYRSKLWTAEEAGETLLSLLQGVTLLFCAQRDAELLFGLTGTAEAVIEQLATKTEAKQIVLSIGAEGAIGWDGQQFWQQPAYDTVMIDVPGAGDALSAGVIHGWLEGTFARGLQMGAALAAMALSQMGDMVMVTPEMLSGLLEREQGRVQR